MPYPLELVQETSAWAVRWKARRRSRSRRCSANSALWTLFASGRFTLDLSLLTSGVGVEPLIALMGACEAFTFPRCGATFAFVSGRLAIIRVSLTVVGDPISIVSDAISFVSKALAAHDRVLTVRDLHLTVAKRSLGVLLTVSSRSRRILREISPDHFAYPLTESTWMWEFSLRRGGFLYAGRFAPRPHWDTGHLTGTRRRRRGLKRSPDLCQCWWARTVSNRRPLVCKFILICLAGNFSWLTFCEIAYARGLFISLRITSYRPVISCLDPFSARRGVGSLKRSTPDSRFACQSPISASRKLSIVQVPAPTVTLVFHDLVHR
ncbi:hypothetical protein [Mycobacterium vicinigordonae]|uniref:Uncharacterized protein n=1 Tax=Mycobacterium vicinigordonae TaxID=1719132 RepID=A0A7D6E560_9MYCO|nr:hypothetical protein [Mycobacterium vicinigordonae]QLL05585.1 hypothetical protein H0P51_17255 [Mycobacterium vicinigordonae]